MVDTKKILIEDYDYTLPDEKIAKYPLAQRDHAKLLIYKEENISENIFSNIANHLPKGGLLVSNNTKVIRARMEFFKETGARVEIFCLEPYSPIDYNVNFAATHACEWYCIVGNLRKWKNGSLRKTVVINGHEVVLNAERKDKIGESHIIRFYWDNAEITFSELLESMGNIPIPPYLNRKSEESDNERYQTIYSKHKGSVAAPTAGLHFTDEVFQQLKEQNITRHEVTLHVGAGTFKPVKSEEIGDHEMHYEQFVITKDTLPKIIDNIGNITAVGTTTVRTLESLYWLGVKCIKQNFDDANWIMHQWEAYDLDQSISPKEALQALHNNFIQLNLEYINASTGIIIAPGYQLKIVNRLITNFHQPKSTLLLLISVFIGANWKDMYNYALNNDFRFLSYGDSCLLYPKK